MQTKAPQLSRQSHPCLPLETLEAQTFLGAPLRQRGACGIRTIWLGFCMPVGEVEGSSQYREIKQLPTLRFRVEKSRPMAGSSPWLLVRASVHQEPTVIFQISSGQCLTLGAPREVKSETLLAQSPISPSLGTLGLRTLAAEPFCHALCLCASCGHV